MSLSYYTYKQRLFSNLIEYLLRLSSWKRAKRPDFHGMAPYLTHKSLCNIGAGVSGWTTIIRFVSPWPARLQSAPAVLCTASASRTSFPRAHITSISLQSLNTRCGWCEVSQRRGGEGITPFGSPAVCSPYPAGQRLAHTGTSMGRVAPSDRVWVLCGRSDAVVPLGRVRHMYVLTACTYTNYMH